MSFYQVDSRQLRSKRDELIGLTQRFRSEKEALCSKEAQLSSMWEGEANESFHTRFIKDSGQMDSFIEVIQQYLNVIQQIADRYDMAEQANVGRAM
ncbi:MAG: WXG100 family type VII secretion target [Lachnospiraceae bacterium]|nr:WXG100 family type VII secretion target [Lachnospiraceae bacterium]